MSEEFEYERIPMPSSLRNDNNIDRKTSTSSSDQEKAKVLNKNISTIRSVDDDDKETTYNRMANQSYCLSRAHKVVSKERSPSPLNVRGWSCRHCTYLNGIEHVKCEICHFGKQPNQYGENVEKSYFQFRSPSPSPGHEKSPYHRSSSRSPSPIHSPYSSTVNRSRHDFAKASSTEDDNDDRQSSKIIEEEQHQTKNLQRVSTSRNDRKCSSRSPSPAKPSDDDNDYMHTFHRSSIEQKEPNPTESLVDKYSKLSTVSPSSSLKLTKTNASIIAYIPDLPSEIDDNDKLEDIIRQSLKQKHKQEVIGVKCNVDLGIGSVYLKNAEEKDYFINTLKSIILNSEENSIIKFVSDVKLISYVVIEKINEKSLPSSDDIAQRWIQLYKASQPHICESLSVQFPNIFRIVSDSLDELIKAMTVKEFSINGHIATVYFRSDCCFFEDLPRNINVDRLRNSIINQICQKNIPKSSLYIQYNKEAANAVILTSGKARKWTLFDSINLDGRVIDKKVRLAYRLLVRPIPKDFSISLIEKHKIFDGTVSKTILKDDRLIVELSNRNVYEKCVDQGALSVQDQIMHMEVYTFTSNPEDSEIDAENWYESEMSDQKSNIMSYIDNPQHPIFRLKWNPQAFLEQFRRVNIVDHDRRGTESNQKRHLLRMTVMLNTIGVVWKGSYRVNEREIKLKPDRLKTIVYDHQSKLQRGKTIPLSDVTKVPFASTLIEVVNEDCLYIYQQLVAQNRRPVLLNMANADSPGGGYRKGDGAQEETIFRRSDYFRSLDIGLDHGKPTSRFYCNSNCELEVLSERQRMYPMNEFGAIYTSGLTVFRQAEDTGYAFMNEPVFDVCSIAMAAYRDPKVENNHLISKFSIGMRKKIENVFAIAYHHKHDCLVLSALGCGAFKNPPKHIAAIFKSVAEQYAGFFKSIYFAILDDHNTGLQFNPQGNYRPFKQLLDGNELKANEHKMQDMTMGPWKILNMLNHQQVTLSDMRICYLIPCYHGGKCNDLLNAQHCREYSHPSLCPFTGSVTSCKLANDEDHMLWFIHRTKCSYGGECRLLIEDATHSNDFEHPQYCREGGRCDNMNLEHLKSSRHVPLCKYGITCLDFNKGINNHCQEYRHCKPICRYGHFCVRFHDEKHINEESHPFPNPCPFTPFHCREHSLLSTSTNIRTLPTEVQNHCLQYSHVCRFGRQCHEPFELHWEKSIHIARNICPYGDKCMKINQEDHLNSFTHPNIADIRRLCDHSANDCRDRRKHDHIIRYRHYGNYDRSGIIRYFGLNIESNFVENQQNIILSINEYHKKTLSIPTEIIKWIRGLQPVHRCGKLIFESILVHGHVMSREHMEHLKKPHFVAQAVQQHKRVRAIFDRHKNQTIEDHAKEYIKAIVSVEYEKKTVSSPFLTTRVTTSVVHEDYNSIVRMKEKILSTLLTPNEVDIISRCAMQIAEASLKLHASPTGIGYAPDKALGTDRHVFSILGPNLGHYYGDIFLVFKSELMHHPDANFSPQAATSFSSGATFKHRPWVQDSNTADGRVKKFQESKLHCSVPNYEYAAAAELMALAATKKKLTDADLKAIKKYWTTVDSHQVFEGHLPQLISLDYIEEIYIPKNLFSSLTPAAQESAKAVFRDSLKITHHDIELEQSGGGGAYPSAKGRLEYQNYVIDKLITKFDQRMEHSRHVRGSIITIAPSQFTDHIVLPLTISQAIEEYQSNHKKHSFNDIYIYWQAMYGDMMITISNEPIDPDRKQPDLCCLVTYIAERPSSTTSDYRESYSYLNCGVPYRHTILQSSRTFASSSNTFHRGCNTDDFLTYCLHIQQKSGQVTLSHAGPNSVYNCQTITYTFPKSILNLSKLDYIHLSAGSQKVPIRNLVICFEPVSDFHPSFDKEFKRDDTCCQTMHKSSTPTKSDEQSPSFLSQLKEKVYEFLGVESDQDSKSTKLDRCPHSINCLFQEDIDHNKKYSHPCQYADMCQKKNDEPHLTHEPRATEHCSMKISCTRLDDPVHRAKYRHDNMPDFLIPCRDQQQCINKLYEHRIKYSHGEHVEITPITEKHDKSHKASSSISTYHHHQQSERIEGYGQISEQIPCRYGLKCRDICDTRHCSTYSHPGQEQFSSFIDESEQRIPCRQAFACRDKHDARHCEHYSHPDEYGTRSSVDQDHQRIPCRYAFACRDKHDVHHSSKYSHSIEKDHRSSGFTHPQRILCRHGVRCRDIHDPHHYSKYSHLD